MTTAISSIGRTVVIDDRCTACGACLVTCPARALLPGRRQPLVVDERCTGCGECVEICPRGAISDSVVIAEHRPAEGGR